MSIKMVILYIVNGNLQEAKSRLTSQLSAIATTIFRMRSIRMAFLESRQREITLICQRPQLGSAL